MTAGQPRFAQRIAMRGFVEKRTLAAAVASIPRGPKNARCRGNRHRAVDPQSLEGKEEDCGENCPPGFAELSRPAPAPPVLPAGAGGARVGSAPRSCPPS